MQNKLRQTSLILSVAAGLFALLTAFQNCAPTTFGASAGSSVAPAQNNGNGGFDGLSGSNGGFDGLTATRYIHQGDCPGNPLAIDTQLAVSANKTAARLERAGCADLATPQPVDVSALQFETDIDARVIYQGRVLDIETGDASQQIKTLYDCQALAGGELDGVHIWIYANDASHPYGNLLVGNSTVSETNLSLSTTAGTGGTNVYYSGQSSVASLDFTAAADGSASAQYRIGSTSSTTTAKLSCVQGSQ